MPRHLKILHEWNPPRLWFSWQKIRQFAGSNFVEIPMLSRSNVQLCALSYSVESDSAHCCTVQRDLRHVQCQPVRSFSVLLIDCVLCKSAVWIFPWQQNYLQNHLVLVPIPTVLRGFDSGKKNSKNLVTVTPPLQLFNVQLFLTSWLLILQIF